MNKHLLLALLAIPMIAGCSASAGTPQPQNSVSLLRYEITREHFPEGTFEIGREQNLWPDPLRIDVPAGSQIIDKENTFYRDCEQGHTNRIEQNKDGGWNAASLDHCDNQLIVPAEALANDELDVYRIIIAY